MRISFNIIIDTLKAYRFDNHVPPDKKMYFSKILPLPDNTDRLQNNCIYIGGLTKALKLRSGGNFVCICLRDRLKDENETEEILKNLIIVNENITLHALTCNVQNHFFSILEWIHNMHETIIKNGTMQDILDLCVPIMDNFIAITDSSLMLIACSGTIPGDDPIYGALAKHGYFSEEAVGIFRKYGMFKKWETDEGIYKDDSFKISGYVTLNKTLNSGSAHYYHAVMICNSSPLTPGLADLFNILTDVLDDYMDKNRRENNETNKKDKTFFIDLLNGNINNKLIIEENAKYLGLPVAGRFFLFQIAAKDSGHMSSGKMLSDFNDLFPGFKAILYKQRIVAINHFYARDSDEQLSLICEKLESFLDKYEAICGVSLCFFDLEEASFAYEQSNLAIKYAFLVKGRSLVQHIRRSQEHRIHFFAGSYIYSLLGESELNSELWYHSEYHDKLHKLFEYDKKHKSNNMKILYAFLFNERNATQTGSMLNMHRNNVIYHITRIEEMLDLDFQDPYTRIMMLISYFLLELNGFKVFGDIKKVDLTPGI